MPTIAQGQESANEDATLFEAGKLGMDIASTSEIGAFAKSPAAWGIAIEPGNPGKASDVLSQAVGIAANSKHKAAAEKWAAYLASSGDAVKIRLDSNWGLPAVSSQQELATYLKKGDPHNRETVFDSAKTIAPTPALGAQSPQIQNVITKALLEIQTGKATASQELFTAATQVDAIFSTH
jgi:multiple sugar transport system substrate-binding protein